MAEIGAYIRDYYKVPADVGRRVRLGDGFSSRSSKEGVIVGFEGHYIIVRLDDTDTPSAPLILHPTWEITYLDEATS